jgi:arsenate reductase (glutaredoxin)
MIIYHNPRCTKSRAGLTFLEENEVDFIVKLYLSDPLDEEDLRRIIMKLNLPVTALLRKQEEQYKKELKGQNFTDDEWIKILLENPKLIQRPIIETKYKAVIGNPVENIHTLIQPFD